MKREPQTLKPVLSNAGIEADYRRKIKRLVAQMNSSIIYWLSSAYKENTPVIEQIAMDATPADALNRVMKKLAKQWLRNFDDGADSLAAWFARATKNYTDPVLKTILKDAGFAVDFRMTPAMKDGYDAVVNENVNLIRSIASRHLEQVETIVMQGVQNGRDLGFIRKSLMKQFGVSNRRAVLIARDQANKATATFNKVRYLEAGITEAIWRHSGAGKHPRPAHVKAGREKLRYDIAKGAYIDGKWIWPGTEINCRCSSVPVIPGIKG